jgi:outer membrane protein
MRKKKIPCQQSQSPKVSKCTEPESDKVLRLIELLDIALINNPLTAQAWAQARAAAAVIGQQEANYWPFFTAQLSAIRTGNSGYSGISGFFATEDSATVSFNWILLDFGTRDYQVENAVDLFKAAKWNYDWTIQSVLLSVLQAYFTYIADEALYAVSLTNLQDTLVVERATIIGHQSGVNTITDVLQAKANRVQAQMNVQNQYSTMLIAHATLANTMGLNPNACFLVESFPKKFVVEKICRDVDQLIYQAKHGRADLAAQRANVQAARATLYQQIATFWPNFTATGEYTQVYVNVLGPQYNFDVQVNMNIPIFSGFSQVELIRQAKAELMLSKAQLKQQELQAFLNVYSAYYTVKTGAVNLVYSKEFLIYSKEAYDSALLGYRSGTLSYIDLQTALVNLQNARATRIQAQTGWFSSLAQLGYNLGCISFPAGSVNYPCGESECWR